MRRNRWLLTAGVVCATGALLPAGAQALTLSFGKPQLSNRILITVPLTVSCTPFEPSLTLFSESVFVTVEQASGKAIAHGTGTKFGFLPNLLFPCDGSSNTVAMSLTADVTGPPFHGGPAIYSAFAGAEAGMPCVPGSTTCFTDIQSQVGRAGPSTLK
jgi:hypothetical protein